MSTTQGLQVRPNGLQINNQTLSILCPPIPTPLAESAFHWGLDGDGRVVQMQTWPGTPAPWHYPTEAVRPPTGRAEPLLPPADTDDEVPMLPPTNVSAINEHGMLSNSRLANDLPDPSTTARKSTEHWEITSGRPPSRGLRLTRSLTNAFRKRPTALQAISPKCVSASLPNTPITLQLSTPDPRNLEFITKCGDAPMQSTVQTDKGDLCHDRPCSSSEFKATGRSVTRASEDAAQKPSTPRRLIHFFWNGCRCSHEIQHPKNYVDQLTTVR